MSTNAIARSPVRGWTRDHVYLIPVVGLLVAFLIVYSVLNPAAFSGVPFQTLAAEYLPLVCTAIAQATVMLVRGVDLSIGAAVSLTGAIFAELAGSGGATVAAIVVALLAGAGTGLFAGAIVRFARLPPIIVTLAASFLWTGLALLILPKPGGHVPGGLVSAYNGTSTPVPFPLLIGIVLLIVWKLIKRTRFGISVYMTGGNERGAFVSGVGVTRAKVGAYVVAGLFTACAGVLLAVQTGTGDPRIGIPYTLNSIAAAVLGGVSFLGGFGEMKGTVCGALVLALVLQVLLLAGVPTFWQLVLEGAILVAAIALRPLIERRGGAS